MDFAGKFLNEYNGISKFVIIWLSLIAHDSANGLYRTDKVHLSSSHIENFVTELFLFSYTVITNEGYKTNWESSAN